MLTDFILFIFLTFQRILSDGYIVSLILFYWCHGNRKDIVVAQSQAYCIECSN